MLQKGELEITFLKTFCRKGNLAALLKDERVPDIIKPYMTRLAALFKPVESVPRNLSSTSIKPLDNIIHNMLVKKLHDLDTGDECKWMAPRDWALLSDDEAIGKYPVQAQAIYHQQIMHQDVLYTNFTASQNNSFVVCKAVPNEPRTFGRISCIFQHRRSSSPGHKFWIRGSISTVFRRFPKVSMIRFQDSKHQVYKYTCDHGIQLKIV